MQHTIDSLRFNNLFEKTRAMSSIYEIMMSDFLDSPASQWLDESGTTVSVSFGLFNEHVKKLALYLSKRVGEDQKGCFVALSMDNSHLWQVCFWALLMAGYKPALIDVNYREEEIDRIVESAEVQAILSKELPELKSKILHISTEELREEINSVGDYAELAPQREDHAEDTPQWEERAVFTPQWADRLALCTSGTTDAAKVFVFDGAAIIAQIEGFYQAYLKEPRIASAPTPVKLLAFLPMHHVLGFITLCITYPMLNKTIVFLKDRSPLSIQDACQKIGVTHLISVPLLINNLKNGVLRKIRNEEPKKEKMLNLLLKTSLFIQKMAPKAGDVFVRKYVTKSVIRKLFGDTLNWTCVGGTYVPVDSLKFMNGLGYVSTIGYGMTECGIIAFEPGTVFKRRINGTTGPLMYGFNSKIVDTSGTATEIGELLVKAPSMHIGRMLKGKMIPANVDEEGWLHTGDIARFDKGSLIIEGRLKEMIITESGENIYPDELESKFDDLMSVAKRYCILGLNNKGSDEIALVVEVQEDANNAQGLAEISHKVGAVIATLPVMKRIKHLYATNEPMPLANGIKVRRQKLKEQIENQASLFTKLQITVNPSDSILLENSSVVPKELPNDDLFFRIREEVIKCVAETLNTTPEKIGADMGFIDDLGGDSLHSLGVFSRVETRFGIMLDGEAFFKCVTANDLSLLLYEKLKGTSFLF